MRDLPVRFRGPILCVLLTLGSAKLAYSEPCISGAALDQGIANLRPSSPLIGLGAYMESQSKRWNIDPRLIAGIAFAETQLGTDRSACVQADINNPWNWFWCLSVCDPPCTLPGKCLRWSCTPGCQAPCTPPALPNCAAVCQECDPTSVKCANSPWVTLEEGIDNVTKYMSIRYLNRKCPPECPQLNTLALIGSRYCKDGKDGCEHWVKNVQDFYSNTEGTLNDLHYTCIQESTPACPGFALQFDGQDDEVLVPDAPSLDFAPGSPMTVECWFYPTPGVSSHAILGRRAGERMNYQISYGEPRSRAPLKWELIFLKVVAFCSLATLLLNWGIFKLRRFEKSSQDRPRCPLAP